MNIKTIKDNFNNNTYIMQTTRVKGRNYLIKKGGNICKNNNFYTNGINYAHYNKHLKYWIFDNNKIESAILVAFEK